MGFGVTDSAQNNLTSLQTSVNTLGANMQEAAANTQATADQAQAQQVLQQTGLSAEIAGIDMNRALGQQAEGYAEGGVEQTGSPIEMLNQTRLLGEQQISAINAGGALQAQLYETQGNLAQQTGLSDLLSAQGQNQISQQTNALNQAQQKNAFLDALFSGGLSALGGATPSALKYLTSP